MLYSDLWKPGLLSFSLITYSLTSADPLRVAPPTSSWATTCTTGGGEREEEEREEEEREEEERRERRERRGGKVECYQISFPGGVSPQALCFPWQPMYPHEVCFCEFKVEGVGEGDGADITSSRDGEGQGLGRVQKVLNVKGEPSIGLL